VDFLNSFSFIFLKFVAKFYQAIFLSWTEHCEIKGVHRKPDRAGPQTEAGRPARSDRPKATMGTLVTTTEETLAMTTLSGCI
jgi:hypothetical protein